MKTKALFLNLTTFSQTGGIEKFNRSFLKALFDLETGSRNVYTNAHSLYDGNSDDNYYPEEKYTGYHQNRIKFVLDSFLKAKRFDYIILGHINLAIIGCLIRLLLPSKKLVLVVHGIEVWEGLTPLKKYLLRNTHKILSVSTYTRDRLLELTDVKGAQVKIFPNTIDPYFPVSDNFDKNNAIRAKYGFTKNDFVLYTLTRLSAREKYKGYDVVIRCLPELRKQYGKIKYIVAGKYDEEEKRRIDDLITQLNLNDVVKLVGFIEEDEVVPHYRMCDLFVMPSQKEGFGIVFIEAMACGTPVIAGNADGSVDALKNGELGMLVNPESVEDVTAAIMKNIDSRKADDTEYALGLQQQSLAAFGFPKFKERLKDILFQSN